MIGCGIEFEDFVFLVGGSDVCEEGVVCGLCWVDEEV